MSAQAAYSHFEADTPLVERTARAFYTHLPLRTRRTVTFDDVLSAAWLGWCESRDLMPDAVSPGYLARALRYRMVRTLITDRTLQRIGGSSPASRITPASALAPDAYFIMQNHPTPDVSPALHTDSPAELLAEIPGMSLKERALIQLRYLDGLSPRAIQKRLGLSLHHYRLVCASARVKASTWLRGVV